MALPLRPLRARLRPLALKLRFQEFAEVGFAPACAHHDLRHYDAACFAVGWPLDSPRGGGATAPRPPPCPNAMAAVQSPAGAGDASETNERGRSNSCRQVFWSFP